MSTDQKELKALGHKVEGTFGIEGLETIDVKTHGMAMVSFETKELTAMCPVTHQPDFYRATIEYLPDGKSVESKTLKLYLNHFKDLGIFGEDLAYKICEELFTVIAPLRIRVTLVQQIRGGLEMTAVAEEVAEKATD